MKRSRSYSKNCDAIGIGTVISIPIDTDCRVLGIVLRGGINFFLGISLDLHREPISCEDIENKKLELFSWTNDAEIFRGNWKIVGHCPSIPKFIPPEYRIFIDGEEMIESLDGEIIRKADPVRDRTISYRKIQSSMLLQHIVQSACGYGDQELAYQDIKDMRTPSI